MSHLPTGPVSAPKVRFLCHGAERSGPPIYLLRLVERWHREPPGFEPEVVLARPGPLSGRFSAACTVRTARLDRRSPEAAAARALDATGMRAGAGVLRSAAIRGRVGRSDAAATVVNGATQPTVELLRALDPRGPILGVAHELSTGWFHNLQPDARALLLDRVDRWLAVSACVESFLVDELGIDPGAVAVGRAPIGTVSGVSARADATVRVGGGGVTDWRKAPELWLRVAHHVVASLPDDVSVEFVWVGGDDPESDAFWPLRHEVAHLGLAERVRFTGEVGDAAAAMSGLDVFVSTAREDAYPLMCVEAVAAGVPVVTFDGGGAAELVRETGCGDVAPYPDEGALARSVLRLIADPERRRRLGSAGSSFVQDHLDPSRTAADIATWIIDGTDPRATARPASSLGGAR